MFKIIIVTVVVTIVGLFVMSKIDPNNNSGNINNTYTSELVLKILSKLLLREMSCIQESI